MIALNRFVQMQAIVIIVVLEVALIVHRMVVLVGAKTADVSANKAGKWKAVFQCIVICALVLGQYLEPYSGSLTAFFCRVDRKAIGVDCNDFVRYIVGRALAPAWYYPFALASHGKFFVWGIGLAGGVA